MIIKLPNTPQGMLIANVVRNGQVAARKGALLVKGADGETAPMLEKIIDGAKFIHGTKAKDVQWKPDSMVIFLGDADRLAEFEAACPGFAEFHAPVITMA
jgi:hypothetical protein